MRAILVHVHEILLQNDPPRSIKAQQLNIEPPLKTIHYNWHCDSIQHLHQRANPSVSMEKIAKSRLISTGLSIHIIFTMVAGAPERPTESALTEIFEQDRSSDEGRPPTNVYLVMLVRPWPMTLILDLDLEAMKTYKNEVSRSTHSNVRARAGQTQTDATERITQPHSRVVK